MSRPRARILFLSDTHLGLDQPRRARVSRRRRGPEFFEAFDRALAPASRGEVDVVVHGGDVLYRNRVAPGLVEQAFAPLRAIADQGIPVLVVPGNHERSHIPHPLLAAHPGIHIFDRPRTVGLVAGGLHLAVAGFPFVRRGLRDGFRGLVSRTGWRDVSADARLLCLHQCVEGATVGPQGYVFREGDDVVRGQDLPAAFAAVLAGHVHRHQVLERDLRGRPLTAPVLYAGSTERTSFAERDETKGSLLIDVVADGSGRGRVAGMCFRESSTRPMVQLDLRADRINGSGLAPILSDLLSRQHPEAIVRVKLQGSPPDGPLPGLGAKTVRALAPPTMNVSLRWTEDPAWRVDT